MKETKLLEVAALQSKVAQFVSPPPEALEKLSSWTLLPPKQAAVKNPKKIGVLLCGQFYIYKVDKKLVEKTNEEVGTKHKAGHASTGVMYSMAPVIQADKKEGVTVAWGKRIISASAA